MDYEFFTVDVFTDQQFGGNASPQSSITLNRPLFCHPKMITTQRASESSLLLERRFSGHPNIGTTFVLAELNRLHADDGGCNGIFEEAAGLVEVQSVIEDGRRISTIRAPRGLDKVESIPAQNAARTVGLGPPS